MQALLDYKQRLQTLFSPEGIAYERKSVQSNRRNGTTFNYLVLSESADEEVVRHVGIDPRVAESLLCPAFQQIVGPVARARALI